jgi:hypothetical protein
MNNPPAALSSLVCDIADDADDFAFAGDSPTCDGSRREVASGHRSLMTIVLGAPWRSRLSMKLEQRDLHRLEVAGVAVRMSATVLTVGCRACPSRERERKVVPTAHRLTFIPGV